MYSLPFVFKVALEEIFHIYLSHVVYDVSVVWLRKRSKYNLFLVRQMLYGKRNVRYRVRLRLEVAFLLMAPLIFFDIF